MSWYFDKLGYRPNPAVNFNRFKTALSFTHHAGHHKQTVARMPLEKKR